MYLFRVATWAITGYNKRTKKGYETASKLWDPKALDVDLSGKHYIVTGANSGLGYSAAESLAKLRGTVHMVCRNAEAGQKAQQEIIAKAGNENVILHVCDVSRPQQLRDFAANFERDYPRLDCLVHNAGVLVPERSVTPEGIETTFATHIVSVFLLTHLLLNVLKKTGNARVITVTSGGMLTEKLDVTNLQATKGKFSGESAYSQCKRAQVILTEKFAELYTPQTGVIFNTMEPGWADTPGVEKSLPTFYKYMKDKLRTVGEGADTIVWLAASNEELATKSNGLFFLDRAPIPKHLPLSNTVPSESDVETLWQECVRLTGVGNTAQQVASTSAQS